MKEMRRILKFTSLESSTFEKDFCVRLTNFSLFRGQIYFPKLFLFSNKFENLLINHLSLLPIKIQFRKEKT